MVIQVRKPQSQQLTNLELNKIFIIFWKASETLYAGLEKEKSNAMRWI